MGLWSQVFGLYEVSAVGGLYCNACGLGGRVCGGTLGGSLSLSMSVSLLLLPGMLLVGGWPVVL